MEVVDLNKEKSLVLGASGFLGSHVARLLAERGAPVRALLRRSSDSRAVDDLNIERCYGDVLDRDSLRDAMQGCSVVFYCVVDTRAWLRDSTPLYRTNIDGLRNAMDVALELGIKRFVFTSTIGTIGRNPSGIATEKDEFNWWDKAPDYIRCRVEAENLLFSYCQEKGLQAVSCNVANTYGPGDYAPTPHGKLVADVAAGKMPFRWPAVGETVGIVDAAQGLIAAALKGRVGERYIITERYLTQREMFAIAADEAGIAPPRLCIPLPVMYSIAAIADVISLLFRKDNRLSVASVRLSYYMNRMDNSKARSELDWQPAPVEQSIREAVRFYKRGHD